jgi:thiol-disulfide isomerase/thioredoxin
MNKLLVFTAEWCLPCRRLKSNLANLADEYANNVKNYDIDIQQEIAIIW